MTSEREPESGSGRLLRLSDAHFPEALDHALAEHGIATGWISATAIVEDVELRVFDPIAGRPGARRRITGRMEAVSLSGPIASTENGPFCMLRAVLSRETDTGIETFAGQLASARILSFEGFLHGAGNAPLDVTSNPAAPHVPAAAGSGPSASAPKSAWAEAISASEEDARSDERAYVSPKQSAPTLADPSPMPRPPTRPRSTDEELFPEAGDLADHFAFGRCEIIKSDGDRLHLKIPRDGRIKEIALEMLKVSLRDSEGGKRVYKLDRKM